MNNIVIGQYIPGDSWIYKIDPRIKLSALVILLVTTFLLNSFFINEYDVCINDYHVFIIKCSLYEND